MTSTADLEASLPSELDTAIYRSLYADLQEMSDEKLRAHYERHGRREGRRPHSLADRRAFMALVPKEIDALEIGPFYNPLLTGERVRYFDVRDRASLTARATRLGHRVDRIPEIHFVSPTGDLGVVDEPFDVVLSSHVIEHQPDLIAHFRAVERILRPGGSYFLLVPDKRYCFDHFLAPSTIAGLLDAHHAARTNHTLRSRIEHTALTTHNDPKRHWVGDHGAPPDTLERTRKAVASYLRDPETFVDVHAWYFEPSTFREILGLLRALEYVRLEVSRVYPTLRGNNEFWAVLRKSGG